MGIGFGFALALAARVFSLLSDEDGAGLLAEDGGMLMME